MVSQSISIPGGDDVNALVLDVGSETFRAGFAGEDQPKISQSSVWRLPLDSPMDGTRRGSPCNFLTSSPGEVRRLMEGGELNAEILNEIISYSFKNPQNGFNIESIDSPIILSEPDKTNLKFRKICLETIFENFNFPATALLHRSSASAFANGKSSALVVDIGASGTTITSVFDGFVIQKPSMSLPIGGNLMNQKILEKIGQISPFYKNFEKVSPEYLHLSRLEVAKDLKHEFSKIGEDETPTGQRARLPDGTEIDVSLFENIPNEILFGSNSNFTKSILETISNCDIDIRKPVASDIILTGGGSLIPGLPEKLQTSLLNFTPMEKIIPLQKSKITASSVSNDRMSSSWLGCSIAASCATFQQLWVSKKQYDEEGFDRINSKILFW
jgi:actin-related protein